MLLVLLAGCAGTTAKPAHEGISLDQHLPLRIAVDMSPEDLAERTQHYYNAWIYYYVNSWYDEGKMVRNAAVTAFSPLAEQVLPRDQMPAPDFIIKVTGTSVYNPAMQNFYINVTATGYLPNGQEMGSFKAKWVAVGVLAFYEQELEKAYVTAFQDIGRQFLQSGALNVAARQSATN